MSTPSATTTAATFDRTDARSGFFFWTSILLLAFLIVGFAPSLYLRSFFDVPPIPLYLDVHGAIVTSWFVWLVLQTSMVRSGRTDTHRRLGVIGAVIAVAVMLAGPMATLNAVGRIRAEGIDWDTDMSVFPELGVTGVPMIRFMAQVVWGNLVSIAVFAGLVAAALLLRRQPEAHKRLMLLASITIVGPALARISRWPKATLYGVGVIVAGTVAQQLIADSELGRSFVRMLG